MFSLGNKEAIVNSTAKYPVTHDTTNDKLIIQGFGTFQDDQLVSAICQRFKSSRNEAMIITAPTATELGIASGTNVPVTFSIIVKTFRDSSEWSTDYLLNGRPLVFEILVTATETSANIGVKMEAAFTEWESKFNYADQGLPFTHADSSGAITLTMKDYTLLFQNRVEFRVNREITTTVATTTKYIDTGLVTGTGATATTVPMADTTGLRVGDKVAIGATFAAADLRVISDIVTDTSIEVESLTFVTADLVWLETTALDPIWDGKYLEENVRMSLPTTSDSYGISPDEKPFISGSYTSIELVMNDATTGGIDGSYAKHAFLGTTRGEVGGTRQFKFTLYILEGTDMFDTGGKVDDILDWIIESPIGTEVLLIANGTAVATTADFIA